MTNSKILVFCVSNSFSLASDQRMQFQFAKKTLKKPIIPLVVEAYQNGMPCRGPPNTCNPGDSLLFLSIKPKGPPWDWQATACGMLLAGELYIDFTDIQNQEAKFSELMLGVRKLVGPNLRWSQTDTHTQHTHTHTHLSHTLTPTPPSLHPLRYRSREWRKCRPSRRASTRRPATRRTCLCRIAGPTRRAHTRRDRCRRSLVPSTMIRAALPRRCRRWGTRSGWTSGASRAAARAPACSSRLPLVGGGRGGQEHG